MQDLVGCMKSSGTMMEACKVEIGWRARGWPLILALVCVTALLQVELSRAQIIGGCLSDNTCPIAGYCCSVNLYCGNNITYCGAGNCLGGCWNTTNAKKKAVSTGVAVGIAIGSVAGLGVLILGIGVCVVRSRARGKDKTGHVFGQDLEGKVSDTSYNRPVSVAPTISDFSKTLSFQRSEIGVRLSYETLRLATDGFREELGRGAFGVVYRGRLLDGTDIAVKRLLEGKHDMKDFEAEVKTLGRINHANLVALLGYSFENNKLFLIYEFVANGSLDRWIFKNVKENAEFVLPWKTRVDILKGTAKGLVYLHEELQLGQTIIHLDIKPQNILVSEAYTAKIADFGLAKLLGSATTRQTLAAGGTKGYMAPEIYVAAVSQKMDVYSFGIVMLEVLSGREHEDANLAPDRVFLPAWTIRKLLDGEEEEVVDHLLGEDQFDADEAELLIWIALLCLQADPYERPGMSSVLRMMEGSIDPPELPSTLQGELEKVERLIGRRLAGDSRDSSDNMIKFSGDKSSSGSRQDKGRKQRSRSGRKNSRKGSDM